MSYSDRIRIRVTSPPTPKVTVNSEAVRVRVVSAPVGKDAYMVALGAGFVGTMEEWLESLKGKTAYQSALDSGFVGTESEWVDSLNGPTVKPWDAGKYLTNDGETSSWQSITSMLNDNEIIWDLGEF